MTDPPKVLPWSPSMVLSLTYRIYTSIRTKQILSLLAPRLHPAIAGIRGRGPDSIAWLTHQLIENALIDDTPLVGTILDLTEAFDHLPQNAPLETWSSPWHPTVHYSGMVRCGYRPSTPFPGWQHHGPWPSHH